LAVQKKIYFTHKQVQNFQEANTYQTHQS